MGKGRLRNPCRHLGIAGFGVWDEWSRGSIKYNEASAEAVWRSIKQGPIGIGTLFNLARDYGFTSEPAKVMMTKEEIENRRQEVSADNQRIYAERELAIPEDA